MKKPALLLLLLLLFFTTTSCKVKYRFQVEPKGTLAKWKYSAGNFIRYDGYQNIAGDLETAVSEYAKPGHPVRIQLVGVIHMADFHYYQKLQKVLDGADLVLWEAVREQGKPMNIQHLQNKPNLYNSLSEILGLAPQLKSINYHRKHFKHCDITMAAAGKGSAISRAQSSLKRVASIKKNLGKQFNTKGMEDYLKHRYAMLLAKYGQMDYRQMSQQINPLLDQVRKYQRSFPKMKSLSNLEKQLVQLKISLAQTKKVIIDQRNQYLMGRIKIELMRQRSAKQPYTLAVFYGAAHHHDLEKRLAKMGYKKSYTAWFKAWSINKNKKSRLHLKTRTKARIKSLRRSKR